MPRRARRTFAAGSGAGGGASVFTSESFVVASAGVTSTRRLSRPNTRLAIAASVADRADAGVFHPSIGAAPVANDTCVGVCLLGRFFARASLVSRSGSRSCSRSSLDPTRVSPIAATSPRRDDDDGAPTTSGDTGVSSGAGSTRRAAPGRRGARAAAIAAARSAPARVAVGGGAGVHAGDPSASIVIAGVATFFFAFVLACVTAIRGDANGSCAPAGGCAGLARGLAFEISSTRLRFAADRSTSSSNAARAAISAHSSGEAAARARAAAEAAASRRPSRRREYTCERTAVPPPGRGSGAPATVTAAPGFAP